MVSKQTSKQTKYSVDWHFAVPVYRHKPEGFAERRQDFIDLILKRMESDPGINRSNKYGWHSSIDFHMWDDDNIRWMNAEIGKFAIDCIRNTDKKLKKFKITIASCWANVNGMGGWNAPHTHYPHHWSGVFYIDVEDCLGDAKSNDTKGCIEFMNPILLAKAFHLPSAVTYQPKDGQMFLFPSGLQHFVHPNLTEKQRITIAFNINVDLPPGQETSY